MGERVKFSVLVPVYNVERYLEQCVRSVLEQSYGSFELILVDDGSEDGSASMCDGFAREDSRVRVFHKPNAGLLHTRRFALERASGEYCVTLDSDDYLEPDTLETLERAIAGTDCDCVIFGIKWHRDGGTETLNCAPELANRMVTDKRELCNILLNDSSYNSLCRKCVRRRCFDGRDYSGAYHISRSEDLLQSLEIMENAKSFLFIPEALYNYRVNSSSITHTICFDGYSADFTVNEAVLAFLARVDVFTDGDYSRLRNRYLDETMLELKRICRHCSSREQSLRGMRSIRDSGFYRDFLSAGYRRAEPLPGQVRQSAARRAQFRIMAALFRRRRFRLFMLLDALISGRQ